jgi:UDP-N-acetylglucosamine acyltransferase
MKIHPAAIVSSAAQIASDVEIGPFSIVESGVEIGSGCRLAGHVTIKEGTTLGCGTTVLEGAILGGLPQHLSPSAQSGRLVIGQRNTVREHVTVNRALNEGRTTRIGDDCMLMIGAHVAHDCQVGNQVILTNNVLLGGHVEVHDRACLGGASAVHQFCRVGRLSMIGAHAKVIQDVPPFVLTDGDLGMLVGLNRVGLRRAGFDRADVVQLKAAYQLIYRRGYSFNEMLEQLDTEFTEGPAAEFSTFFRGGNNRGFAQERRRPPRAAIRLHRSGEEKERKENVEPKRVAG